MHPELRGPAGDLEQALYARNTAGATHWTGDELLRIVSTLRNAAPARGPKPAALTPSLNPT